VLDDTFALRGGTAINLFVRDMPRLSVDLGERLKNQEFPLRTFKFTVTLHRTHCIDIQP
jgi:hypothetical protein